MCMRTCMCMRMYMYIAFNVWQILRENGGIYIDNDCIVVNEFERIRKHHCVVSKSADERHMGETLRWVSGLLFLRLVLSLSNRTCNCSLEFLEILGQNLLCYGWQSVSGISKIMHCGILINMPYCCCSYLVPCLYFPLEIHSTRQWRNRKEGGDGNELFVLSLLLGQTRSSLIHFVCIGVTSRRGSNSNAGEMDQTWYKARLHSFMLKM